MLAHQEHEVLFGVASPFAFAQGRPLGRSTTLRVVVRVGAVGKAGFEYRRARFIEAVSPLCVSERTKQEVLPPGTGSRRSETRSGDAFRMRFAGIWIWRRALDLPVLAYLYFLQQMRSVERSVREIVEGEGPYISCQIVAMSSRRCSSVSGSTSCGVTLITTLESMSGCASAFRLCEFALDLFVDSICVVMDAPIPSGRRFLGGVFIK